MKKSEREAQKLSAIENLREYLPAGSTVYISLSHVSRSGMSRVIKCLVHTKNEGHYNISHLVALATENPLIEGFSRGVRVTGCGMDMGFALIDSLSYALYSKPCQQTDEPTGGIRYQWI